ncbi:MAG: nucleotidyltransferase domain-containing protein [Actinobacteria bacterium]|nr:nucleotidyltransferase domain-containing protein [Actinomycetota bacterium]MBU4385788.1 nucleotidyltransferase domain-containing protein [Actinomycetota bacterium]
MQRPSSPFAKIRYLDKEAVRRALDLFLDGIKENHLEVKKVILFGSFAKGTCVPSSDVDLLIVLEGTPVPFPDRIVEYLPSRFPVGVDVFPYTEAELDQMVEQGNLFIKGVLEEGIEVFSRGSRA